MNPFSKILVPVDFSPHSSEGVRLASNIARRYEAALVLVHVYQPVAYPFPEGFVLYTPNQMANMLSELRKLLEGAEQEAQSAGAPSVSSKLLQGVVASEIVSTAQDERFDLIVMGTHGRTGIQHALMGSVAEKVVRRAPCPVLTVRERRAAA
jgi:nucleotide-binding universal stress UspA family protein